MSNNSINIETVRQDKYDMQKRLDAYIPIIAPKSYTMLVACPYIVEVGAYTVGTDENHIMKLRDTWYPTLFSKESVDKILSNSFTGCNGRKVQPRVYTEIQWYQEKVDTLTFAIEMMNKLEKNLETKDE